MILARYKSFGYHEGLAGFPFHMYRGLDGTDDCYDWDDEMNWL